MRTVYFTYLGYFELPIKTENLISTWTVYRSETLPVKDDALTLHDEVWFVNSRMWMDRDVVYIDLRPGPGNKRWR